MGLRFASGPITIFVVGRACGAQAVLAQSVCVVLQVRKPALVLERPQIETRRLAPFVCVLSESTIVQFVDACCAKTHNTGEVLVALLMCVCMCVVCEGVSCSGACCP